MDFLNSGVIKEQQEILNAINNILNTNIDEKSIYKIKDLYIYCLKMIDKENDETFIKLYDVIINKMFIEGLGFDKKMKKAEIYLELEKNIDGLVEITFDIFQANFQELLKEGKKTQSDSKLFDLVISALLIGTILKLMEKYKDFIPLKRVSKNFKKEYPLLSEARKKYINEKEKEEEKKDENEYIKVHNNNGINEVIEQSPLINKKDIEIEEDGCIKLELTTNKGKITLDIMQGQNIRDVITFKENNSIGAAEQYLLIYIMKEVFKQLKPEDVKKGCSINIDVQEFCKLRNIPFRSEIGNEIIKSLKKLEKIIIEYDYTAVEKDTKGKKKVVQKRLKKSPLVLSSGMIETLGDNKKTVRNQSVGVVVGKWIETLDFSQFQYRKKDCFTYNIKNTDDSTVSLSDYINNLHRNNLKNNLGKEKPFKVRVVNLTKLLGVNEDRIKSKGYTNVLKKPLEKKLNDIKEKENFHWKYKNGNHKSRKEFEEDVIIFSNSNLDNYYKQKGFKNSKK